MSRTGSASDNRRRVGLPLRVENWYYKHGLFLSSYPTCATSCAIVVLLFCCYPLIYIPLPGTIPTKVVLPYSPDEATDNATNIFPLSNITSNFEPPFPWAHVEPFIYVQQIVLRASVTPWNGNLILTDAYRAPLAEAFKLLEIIRNHEVEESHITLGNLCLHVENVKTFKAKDTVFPEYNCLILSPANFWQQNTQMFNKDTALLNTIFQFHNLQKTKVSIAEMLFGISIRDTGVKRYPIRARPRIIQFAVTLILREKNQQFLSTLKDKLTRIYTLHHTTNSGQRESLTYIYYPGEFRVLEVMPLTITFILLFYYVYFSLRKIDLIRSRLLLAFTAVFTVLGSLIMSLGLCFFFGLTISIQSKGIFPYLVVLVGLENVLVITKCITSTDEKLDVKIRVAKGLANEGWSISKTLLTEITILTVGLATFVPVIQEFCIFAIVGLISDYFLQMLLFSTVLALNIRPFEHSVQLKQAKKDTNAVSGSPQTRLRYSSSAHATTMSRSQSHPKLSGLMLDSVNHISTDVIPTPSVTDRKIPKRVKIVNFWARTRFFQRAFMIWMIVWIFSIIYNSNILESLFVIDSGTEINSLPTEPEMQEGGMKKVENDEIVFNMASTKSPIYESHVMENDESFSNISEQLNKLRHPDYDTNHYLSNFHWSAILRQYNISMSGKYVTILPTIRLSHAIAPEVAITLRNPDEKSPQQFQWKALAVALDPIDFSDAEHQESPSPSAASMPFYPKSPMEIFLASILCAISIFVLTYTLVVLYRCICTRNYAEWRASWTDVDPTSRPRVEHFIQSSTPISVTGHRHRVECLAMDGIMVASSCLEGNIRIWDVNGGELIAEINRLTFFKETQNQRNCSPIWCLDFVDNLIAVGCSDGRIEFWEGSTGNLKCVLDDEKNLRNGVTHIKLTGDRVIVARLCGRVDFLRLETYSQGKQIDWGFTSAYRRTHVRTGSTGSLALIHHSTATGEELRCIVEIQHKAHQQSITCLEVMHGTVFTGSQDNTLKVFRLDNRSLLYTLHGHYGPITCLFIDQNHPGTGGSGSQEGLLCVWDLTSGACVYGIQAHDGAIVSLVCSPSYVISLGSDERLCIWERFQGHLLNSINVLYAYSILLMLTPSLLIATKPGSLIVWDVRTGEPTREVKLDSSNSQLCPRLILASSDCVICDYGNELRIVRFPLAAEKID